MCGVVQGLLTVIQIVDKDSIPFQSDRGALVTPTVAAAALPAWLRGIPAPGNAGSTSAVTSMSSDLIPVTDAVLQGDFTDVWPWGRGGVRQGGSHSEFCRSYRHWPR